MDADGSVTYWIGQLKAGERDAVRQLWEVYYRRLVGLARVRLQARPRLGKDEEDVALSAFDSFFRAVEKGRFPNLEDRDDLWQVLVMLANRKAVDARRKEAALKHGGGKVRNASALAPANDSNDGSLFAVMIGTEPDPGFVAEVTEECQRLLALLPDDQLRTIALAKLEGYENTEIAAQIGRAVSSVERKLALIRQCWSRTEAQDEHGQSR